MSETYTIKPDGGGDYTTIAAAEAARRGDMTGRGVVTFECYDGVADLGMVAFSGTDWPNSSSSNYIRVYVPLAERHDGTLASGGAWINTSTTTGLSFTSVAYARVEGLRVIGSGNYGIYIYQCNGGLIDSCLSLCSSSLGSIYASLIGIGSSGSVQTIQNNIVYGQSTIINIGIRGFVGQTAATINFINNTVDGCVTAGIELTEQDYKASLAYLNSTLENNICTNNGTDFITTVDPVHTYRGTITANNNASEDLTADDWAGSGNITGQTPSDLFVTEGSDVNLKAGSNAIDTGKTQATFDWDALHESGDAWRPQGSAWDMGALELEQAASDWDNKIGGVVPGKVGGVDAGNIGKVGGV